MGMATILGLASWINTCPSTAVYINTAAIIYIYIYIYVYVYVYIYIYIQCCWSTGGHGGTVVYYRSTRAILESPRDGEYMVMMFRGYLEHYKGCNIKGHNTYLIVSKYQKGIVGISI
jgi:hypothetical protein